MLAILNYLKKEKQILYFAIVLIACICIYFYIYYKPITNHAYIVTNVVPVSAEVSGKITNIYVKNGQRVKKGDLLFAIEADNFQSAVDESKASLKLQKNKLSTMKNDVLIQNARIQESKADEFIAYETNKRIEPLAKRGAVSKQQRDVAKANLIKAKAKVNVDKASLEKLKNLLKVQMAKIESLEAIVRNAEIELSYTKVYASTDGIINNFYLVPGIIVNAYSPLFSIAEDTQWWVQANFYEVNLANVRPGQHVKIKTRMYGSDKVFNGVVSLDEWAILRGAAKQEGILRNITEDNQWITLPERLPVMIKIIDTDSKYPLHPGMSVYVSID